MNGVSAVSASLVALVVFALDQLAKWIVTGPLGIDQLGDQLYAAADLQVHLHREQRHLARPAQRHQPGRALDAGRADQRDRGRRRVLDRAREEPRSTRSRSGWCSAARSATSSTACRHGYVVDFADLHFGEFRPFLVFNVGDAAISIGVVILLLRAFLTRKDHAKGPAPRRLSNMRKALPPSSWSPPSRPAAAPLFDGRAQRPTNSRSRATRR